MPNYTLYFCSFEPRSSGHGGEQWDAAVAASTGASVRVISSQEGLPKCDWLQIAIALIRLVIKRPSLLAALKFLVLHDGVVQSSKKELLRELVRASRVALELSKDSRCIIGWHGNSGLVWTKAFSACGYSYAVAVQNVESLVPGQSRNKLRSLDVEIKCLAAARELFVTGYFDAHLLGLFGLTSTVIPLRIADQSLAALHKVRWNRKFGSSRYHYFMYGTYGNPPTRLGFEAVLAAYPNDAPPIKVAGFGSKNLTHAVTNRPNVTILGQISTEDLYRELEECIAVIVWQPPTTGCLMKLSELREASVPVLCNFFAARGQELPVGSMLFGRIDDLFSYLRGHGVTAKDRDQDSQLV